MLRFPEVGERDIDCSVCAVLYVPHCRVVVVGFERLRKQPVVARDVPSRPVVGEIGWILPPGAWGIGNLNLNVGVGVQNDQACVPTLLEDLVETSVAEAEQRDFVSLIIIWELIV